MDRMWSPWRSGHVSDFERRHRPSGLGTVFQEIGDQPEMDDEHFVIWRGTRVFVVMNLYPYNNGHLLVVPYRQVRRYLDLEEGERSEIGEAIALTMKWLDAALSPEGYNVGMNEGEAGGAGIPDHLHVHVVPRWSGDTNFMPVTAEVKLIAEAMEDTFQKLRQAVQADRSQE